MLNGNVLRYVKQNRQELLLNSEVDEEEVRYHYTIMASGLWSVHK